ncbi:hydroxyacid dehydrogenase [Paenibacillus cremeus]|uniref:Hydroxyacid dehydrogenase n=1 Tax=Paenibacillus cremeus TaxID=2163881 RepID=A0A559JVP1_9BACL|nr:hydroxyacid dehydrogenase [Paenibacillus cremeus]TVY03964.1 hydroxyacid dehydrogenase [Paenibacillus cremeus]
MRKILVLIQNDLISSFFSEQTKAEIEALGEVEWNPYDRALTEEELIARIPGVYTLITSWRTTPVTDAVLDAADELKLVAHMAGSIRPVFPNWSVYDRGIRVLNSNFAIGVSVSENVLALILALGHKILPVDREMKQGLTKKHVGMETFELRGKTVGLVGLGMVAHEVIKLLKPFGVKVLGYDPFVSEAKASELGVQLAPLNELMAKSDIISLHAPKVPETYRMIGREQLALIKDGALFINTARGDLIDESALLEALKQERFSAALDVFEVEPLAADSEFRHLPNVIARPHLAGVNPDSRLRIGKLMVEDMRRLYQEEQVLFEVKREQLAIMT